MKKYITKNYNITALILIIAMAMLCSIMIIILLFPTNRGIANAEEGILSQDVKNYIETEYNEQTELVYDGVRYILNIYQDDYIVNYIPKTLFLAENTTLNIYEEYGYFVHTFRDKKFQDAEVLDNMHSYVLVFTIDYSTAEEESITKDRFSYTITPIFQREYISVLPNGNDEHFSVGFYSNMNMRQFESSWEDFLNATFRPEYLLQYNLSDDVNRSEGVVAPAPQRTDDVSYACELFYDEINIFNLTDIAVAANIYNEQELNESDEDYNVLDDQGCFIIGTGIQIAAHEYTGEYDFEGMAKATGYFITKGIVSTAIGCVKIIGQAVSTVWEVADFIREAEGTYFGNQFSEFRYDSYYGTDIYANSKSSQMELTGGRLYKSSAITMTAMENVEAWLRVNDYFTGVFEVSNSTGNAPGWKTAVEYSVGLSVKCVIKDFPTTTNNSAFYTDTFNAIRYKPLAEGVSSEVYVMAPNGAIKGKDYFAFVPDTTGFYTFTLTNGSGVTNSITHGNIACTATDLGYYMEEDEAYIIILTNGTTSLKRPTVKVSMTEVEADFGDEYTFDLPANTTVVLTADFANVVTAMEVQGTDVSIWGVENSSGTITARDTLAYHNNGKGVRNIYIENTSSSVRQCTLSFEDVGTLAMGDNTGIAGDIYVTYYKFVPTSEALIFELSFGNIPVGFSVLDEDGDSVVFSMENNVAVVYGLSVGDTYYLGFESLNDSTSSGSVQVKVAENNLKWYVDGVPVNGQQIALNIGRTYNVWLQVGNEATTTLRLTMATPRKVHISDGILTIDPDAAVGDEAELYCSWVETAAEGQTEYMWFGLLITLEPHAGFTISSPENRATEIDVRIEIIDPLINSIEYEFTYRNLVLIEQTISGSKSFARGTDVVEFTLSGIDEVLYPPAITVTGVNSATTNEQYSAQMSFNVSYAKGNGTAESPYILNCSRHYMAFLLAAGLYDGSDGPIYWTMGADVTIPDSFSIPIPEFYGVFDGGGYTLSGLTLEIPASSFSEEQNYGWAAINKGTIKNVKFTDVTISAPVCHSGAWVNIGVAAGTNAGLIENVEVMGADVNTNRNMSSVGGIAGCNDSGATVINCIVGITIGNPNTVQIFSNGDTGLICGENWGTVDECLARLAAINYYATANNRSIGGIVGYCPAGQLTNCTTLIVGITVAGADAGIVPSIGTIVGNIKSSVVFTGNEDATIMDLEKLPESQRANSNTGVSGTQYGYREE